MRFLTPRNQKHAGNPAGISRGHVRIVNPWARRKAYHNSLVHDQFISFVHATMQRWFAGTSTSPKLYQDSKGFHNRTCIGVARPYVYINGLKHANKTHTANASRIAQGQVPNICESHIKHMLEKGVSLRSHIHATAYNFKDQCAVSRCSFLSRCICDLGHLRETFVTRKCAFYASPAARPYFAKITPYVWRDVNDFANATHVNHKENATG